MFYSIKRDLFRALSRFRTVKFKAVLELYVRALRLQFSRVAIRQAEIIPRKENLVITLTTIPSRLDRIVPVLMSLIDQDVPADRIILAAPVHSLREDAPYSNAILETLPDEVTVLRCEDQGPATKLLPALKEYPGSLLVVVDDDAIYPRNFIATLLAAHRRIPDAAFGYRGVQIKGETDFADLHHKFATAVKIDMHVDILFGTWGYLVPPGALGKEVHNFSEYPDEVHWVDDVWISGHLAKRGVPRYVMPASKFPVETQSSYRESLTGGKNRSGKNDRIAIEAFKSYWAEEDGKRHSEGEPND